MVNDFEFFHGVVLTRIIHYAQTAISIKRLQNPSNASYVVNDSIGLYVKYSSKRMTPWRFTFTNDHQHAIKVMKSNLQFVYVLLVCNDDGILCLDYSELNILCCVDGVSIGWISAVRHKREMYSAKGSVGELSYKIGQSEFPGKLFKTKQGKLKHKL